MDKIIDLIIKITTKHSKTAIIVFIILTVLSIVSLMLFFEANLTLRGTVGTEIDVVKEYDSIMRDFKISNPIIVIVSSDKKKQDVSKTNADNTEQFKDSTLNFADKIKKRLMVKNSIIKGVLYTDENFSEDETTFMIIVIPEKNSDDINNSMEFVNEVKNQIDYLMQEFTGLNIEYTGFSVIQKEETKAMSDNFFLFSVITIILILIIFFVGLKRFTYPIMAMIPLMMGMIVMMGISSIIIKPFDMISLMTPIIMIGLGIDYAIHIGTRYGEVRAELGIEATTEEVLRQTLKSIGVCLLLSMITTAFVFLTLTVSAIRGLFAFGVVAALSMIITFGISILILPIVIRVNEKRYRAKNKLFISGQKFDLLGKFSDSKWSIIVSIIIILYLSLSIIYLPKIKFEKDLMKLQAKGLRSVELFSVLEDKFDFSDIQSFFVVNGYDNLIEFRKKLAERDGEGKYIYTTLNIEQSLDARMAIMKYKKEGWSGDKDDIDKYTAEMKETYDENLITLYEFLIKYYVNHEKNKYLIAVNPNEYVWDEDFLELHLKELKLLEERTNTKAAGMVKISEFYYDKIIKDFSKILIISIIIVIIVILISTRSIKAVFICNLSLVISIVATLTTMSILGIDIHSYNFIAFPLIIGIGIDDTIHVYYRIVNVDKNIKKVISSSGKAILMTTLTTLSAFGTIIFSVHRGLSQFAIVTCIGLVFTFISSVTIIPTSIRLLFPSDYGSKHKFS